MPTTQLPLSHSRPVQIAFGNRFFVVTIFFTQNLLATEDGGRKTEYGRWLLVVLYYNSHICHPY